MIFRHHSCAVEMGVFIKFDALCGTCLCGQLHGHSGPHRRLHGTWLFSPPPVLCGQSVLHVSSLVSCLSSQLSFRKSHNHAGDFRKPHIPPGLGGTGSSSSSSSSFSSQHKDCLPKRRDLIMSGDPPTQLIPCPRVSFLAFLTI